MIWVMVRKKRIDFFCIDVVNRVRSREIDKDMALRILRGKELSFKRLKKRLRKEEDLILKAKQFI